MTDLTPKQKSMCEISYLMKRKKEKNYSPELELQKKIADYLKTNYPGVYFISDALGLNTSWGIKQILLQTNSEHKHLDIVVLKRSVCWNFSGLVLELKSDSPFNKDGSIRASKDDHLLKQYEVIKMLRMEGYKAEFEWRLEIAIEVIHAYLGMPVVDNEPLF